MKELKEEDQDGDMHSKQHKTPRSDKRNSQAPDEEGEELWTENSLFFKWRRVSNFPITHKGILWGG